MTRRGFLTAAGGMVASTAVPAFAKDRPAAFRKGARRFDPSFVALISDLHVNGLKDEVPTHCYEEVCFRKTVDAILALDPLPANVVCFGDIAYHWGQPEDYPLVASLLKPLTDAGIKLTLGMGNHDRRDNFLAQWPEYAKTSPVPGRIVSKVELPHVDLLMLDTLNALEVEKKKPSKPGELDNAQREWLRETLKAATKPVLTCAHHKPNEDKVKLAKLLLESVACKGHIHGHWHKWARDAMHDGWNPQHVKPYVGLPSTGHWGDIGFATMRTFPDRVEITNHQDDFFFTGGPGDGQPMRDDIVREQNNQKVTLRI
ncbi:MAG: metallophosphoesterase [Kiritimatiellae bacterium]|nr:metallophosphoesterase [Kiritimatiellia bacterium]